MILLFKDLKHTFSNIFVAEKKMQKFRALTKISIISKMLANNKRFQMFKLFQLPIMMLVTLPKQIYE